MRENVFKRIEQKYILTKEQYKLLQSIIKEKFNKDKYYKSRIYNLYFDNDNNDIIINSLEKPKYKGKIRVRSYNEISNDDDIVFLEMKQKYKGTVYKRRIMMTFSEYKNYINNKIYPGSNGQIMKELDYYINYYKLYPYIFVAYDRLSYYSKEDIDFRITFDNNLRWRKDNLSLSDNKNNKLYFEDNKYIMEVKSINNLPIWFVNELSKNKIYPTSFFKVGSIYMKDRRD